MSPSSSRTQPPIDNQIVENRFRDVWEAIDDLRERKQNKIGPMVWIPILLWLFTSSAGIIWGSATLVAEMENLTASVEKLSSTQVDTKDLALRDHQISTNQGAIDELKAAIARIEAGIAQIDQKLQR